MRDLALYSGRGGRYANNKIKIKTLNLPLPPLTTVLTICTLKLFENLASRWLNWNSVFDLICVRLDFSMFSHCLWCISEGSRRPRSSWNLFLSLNVKVKHKLSHWTASPGTRQQKKTNIHVLIALSVCFPIHNFSFLHLLCIFRKYHEIGELLSPFNQFTLDPVWNLRK